MIMLYYSGVRSVDEVSIFSNAHVLHTRNRMRGSGSQLLNCQMLLDQPIRQLNNPPLSNPPPPIQNRKPIRILPRKRQLLLNQQHRQPVFFDEAANNLPNLRHNIRLNPLPRLIQNQQTGLNHQRPANGQLLLLPTGKVAASTASHFLQHRKQLISPLGDFLAATLGYRPKRTALDLMPQPDTPQQPPAHHQPHD